MNVLFATDGSESAGRAQRLVASIAWPAPTRITVLHVDQLLVGDLELPPDAYTALHEKIREEVHSQLAETVRAIAGPGRTVDTEMILGRPGSTIVEEARRLAADVIVVGSHGRGPVTSTLIGSVAAEVTDHAPCPVLVARSEKLERAVLAVDGSDGARQAEQLVAAWPFLHALPVRVVSAWHVTTSYALDPIGSVFLAGEVYQQLVDQLSAEAEGIARDAARRLVAAGVMATAAIPEGAAGQAIVETAREERADLIVIGTRGRTGLARLFLGSVARSVLLHSPGSVLVVRQRVER